MRGSVETSIAWSPPHDCPITATFDASVLPKNSLPLRAFSAAAQSTASSSCSHFVGPDTKASPVAEASAGPIAITRNPCEATSVRKFLTSFDGDTTCGS
jgi:hypothetical protein